MRCNGNMTVTRCTIEDTSAIGVFVGGGVGSSELVDCVIRRNNGVGLVSFQTNTNATNMVTLRGGMISEDNKGDGVLSHHGCRGHSGERGGQAADRLQGQ